MAISEDSAVYRLQFTDGSEITLLNASTVWTSPGEYTFIYHNLLWSNFENWSGPITKYDKKGNQYDFYPYGVEINGDMYGSPDKEGSLISFNYDPDDDILRIWWSTPNTQSFPDITDSLFNLNASVFNGNCGSSYDSIGKMIATGQSYLNVPTIGGHGSYNIRNYLPRAIDSPFNSLTRFVGNVDGDIRVNGSIFYSGVGSTVTISGLDTILEDYDPIVPEPPQNDPFEPGGISGEDGGNGGYDPSSDPIDIPSLPSLSAVDTGFITLFNPTLTELRNLASYMWGPLFDVDTFKKIFADPMDCILGLSIVPVQVPNGSSKVVKVGNISTGVQLSTAATQYVEVDCGSLTISEYWGAYLDYEPFTKCEIYLPYIGTHAICTDDIMGKTVSIKYHVDILSGACTAYVKAGDKVLYEFIGQCSSSIPISANDWTNVINGVLTIAASIGTMVATGGAAAPSSEGAAARAVTHKQLTAIHETQTIASTAVNSLKPTVEKSGAMGGTGGLMAIQKPYIIITRPRQALPQSQNYFTGYPSFITEMIGNLSGYTIVEAVHLTGIPGTNEEVVEIENILKMGVIL